MNLNIKTTNITLTPELRDYLEKKLTMLDKLVDFNAKNVYVKTEIGRTSQHHKTGDVFRAELSLVTSSVTFRAVAEEDDLYTAIDIAKDELSREIKSGKKKKNSIMLRGARRVKNILRFGGFWRRRKKDQS